MNKGFLRTLGSVLLLAIGFFIGTAWHDKIQDGDYSPQDTEENAPSQNSESEDNAPPPSTNSYVRQVNNAPALTDNERHTIQLFENAAPSVAFINTSNLRQDYFSRSVTEYPAGSGSAFVWDQAGHIVTNFHVIKDAQKFRVTLSDGTSYDAEFVGGAREKDLAVLKIDAPRNKLVPIPVGRSSTLMVGQSVYAIGNPFGLDQTLTTGIISALGREIKSTDGFPIRDVIQTDAAINPGNSGGPLLDSGGNLIGVNTAIYSPSGASAGIGFSIPVDDVSWIVPDLIQYGKVNRPVLGVSLVSNQFLARYDLKGALILEVVDRGPAQLAGLKPTQYDRYGNLQLGDLIVDIDGKAIANNNDLLLVLEEYKPGDVIKVTVERESKLEVLELELGESN